MRRRASTDDDAFASSFRDALASWATGVSVVTTRTDDKVYGTTVSSFASLSLDPPLVLVCLMNGSRLLEMITAARGFAVSVLAHDQQAASANFASRHREAAPSFAGCAIDWTVNDMPAVEGALAVVACRLHASYVQGDHTIVIGHVVDAHSHADKQPLVYHRRRYRGLDEPDAPATTTRPH